MRMNFIQSMMVRQTHYLCSEAALHISSGEGNKTNSMEDKRKANEGKITYLVNGPRDNGMSEG